VLISETCNGEVSCPVDDYESDGTNCDDKDTCTETSKCQAGVCRGEDTLCVGVCGDGTKAEVIHLWMMTTLTAHYSKKNVMREATMANLDTVALELANLKPVM
jgi:hypothetical protein